LRRLDVREACTMRPIIVSRPNGRRRLAKAQPIPAAEQTVLRVARDFDEIAEDLERGLIQLRHP